MARSSTCAPAKWLWTPPRCRWLPSRWWCRTDSLSSDRVIGTGRNIGRGRYEHRYGVSSIDALLHDPPLSDDSPTLLAVLPAGATSTNGKEAWEPSDLYLGDNLRLMSLLLERGERFGLIYADPPFNSGKTYTARRAPKIGEQFSTQVPAYSDAQGHDAYLQWLETRLALMR